MHKANTLLNAVVSAVTGLATTGQEVEQTRGYPKADKPAITVRLVSVDPFSTVSNAFIDSFVDVETIYHVSGDSLDAQILQIDAEVWAAIMADVTIGGTATDTDPQTLTIETSADAEEPTASGVRRWRCRLRNSITNAEA